LALQWGLDYVERSSIFFDPLALAQLSREDAQRLEALPTRVEDGHFVVAVAGATEERLAARRRVIGEEAVMVVVAKTARDAGLTSELLARRADAAHKVPELAHPPPIEDGPLWGPPPLPPQPLPLEEEPAAEEPPPAAYEAPPVYEAPPPY